MKFLRISNDFVGSGYVISEKTYRKYENSEILCGSVIRFCNFVTDTEGKGGVVVEVSLWGFDKKTDSTTRLCGASVFNGKS